jgi:hypothetical protein
MRQDEVGETPMEGLPVDKIATNVTGEPESGKDGISAKHVAMNNSGLR